MLQSHGKVKLDNNDMVTLAALKKINGKKNITEIDYLFLNF